jgi:hypothetical protein
MLNHVRSLAGVPKQGTDTMQIFTPQFDFIAPRNGAPRQGIMDGTGQDGLPFCYAAMTESHRAELGPLPLLDRAWGKEPN